MMKIQLDARDVMALAEHAKAAGTERRWMDLALEWIEHADAEIKRMTVLLDRTIP